MAGKSPKTIYTCQSCGYQVPKWMGKCPDCGQWDSLLEETLSSSTVKSGAAADPAAPVPIDAVDVGD
jgi:DNA repair protein RadA/Sms